MADVDELFNCFDEEEEEKQPTVPIVVDVDDDAEENVSNEWVNKNRKMCSSSILNFIIFPGMKENPR